MKNVIIIEDDEKLASIMRDLINQLDDYHCEFIFNNPVDFIQSNTNAHVVVLDIVMPGMNGLEAIPKILKLHPETSIIINSIKDDTETIFKALQLGAVGYIDKQSFQIDFLEVFNCVLFDGAYMTPRIARKIITFFQKPRGIYNELKQREVDIVNGILEGLSYKMIAAEQNISIETVRFHIKTIYRKLKINSKSELFNLFKMNP